MLLHNLFPWLWPASPTPSQTFGFSFGVDTHISQQHKLETWDSSSSWMEWQQDSPAVFSLCGSFEQMNIQGSGSCNVVCSAIGWFPLVCLSCALTFVHRWASITAVFRAEKTKDTGLCENVDVKFPSTLFCSVVFSFCWDVNAVCFVLVQFHYKYTKICFLYEMLWNIGHCVFSLILFSSSHIFCFYQ